MRQNKKQNKLTEGTTTSDIGPSPSINESFFSCSSAAMIMGSAKTMVFPDPVNAIPIKSLPESLNPES